MKKIAFLATAVVFGFAAHFAAQNAHGAERQVAYAKASIQKPWLTEKEAALKNDDYTQSVFPIHRGVWYFAKVSQGQCMRMQDFHYWPGEATPADFFDSQEVNLGGQNGMELRLGVDDPNIMFLLRDYHGYDYAEFVITPDLPSCNAAVQHAQLEKIMTASSAKFMGYTLPN